MIRMCEHTLDSGALTTVANDNSFEKALFDISGMRIATSLKISINFKLPSKPNAVKATRSVTTRGAHIVMHGVEGGLTFVLSPQGSCITKDHDERPQPYESMTRRDGSFDLDVAMQRRQRADIATVVHDADMQHLQPVGPDLEDDRHDGGEP